MMQDLIPLDTVDLISAIALMVIAVGLSAWEDLGLEIKLLTVTGRTILQLLVLGYVLDFIAALNNLGAVLAILAILVTVAAIVTRNRIGKKIPLVLPLVWVSIFLSMAIAVLYANFLIINPSRWYEPRYVIPLAGMIIGQAMNAAAITGDRLVSTINSSHVEIETHLSLGATPSQAVAQYRKEAIKAGLIPTINQMTIIALVTLPTFMSGQLLGGIHGAEAASYEILVIFLMAFANLLTTILITRALCHQFFNSKAQLVS
jgi:putative ABC transport system permease protein